MLQNYPNLSRQRVVISPQGPLTISATDIGGQQQTYTLPQFGLIQDLWVQTTVTTAGNNNPILVGNQIAETGNTEYYQTSPLGLGMFQLIQLMSNNRQICSMTDQSLRARVDSLPMAKGLAAKYRTRAFSSTDGRTLATVWSANSVTTYVPIYFSFWENLMSGQDLSLIQQLQLVLTWNTTANAGYVAAIDSATTYLIMDYYNLSNDELALYRSLNYNPAGTYNALSYDVYQETPITLGNNLTTYTFNCNCQNAVYATAVYLRNTTYNTLLPITSLTITMAGRVIYSVIPDLIFSKDQDCWGGAGLLNIDTSNTAAVVGELTENYTSLQLNPLITLNSLKPTWIWWGLEPGHTFNAGAISLHNISNFQITATFASTSTGGTTQMCVVHHLYTLFNVNPQDGAVSVSVST